MKEHYREHGYVLARGVFSTRRGRGDAGGDRPHPGRRRRQRARREPHLEPEAKREALVLKGFHNVQYHDAAFTRAAAHPRLVAVLTELIGPNVQLHHTKMLVKPPEQGASFPMHQDYPYFPHERHSVLAASVHLDDADDENGCLRVVPGSHARGPLEAHGPSHTLDVAARGGVPLPAAAGRRAPLQLPDRPRLGRRTDRPHAPQRPLPVPRPGGPAGAARRPRGARRLGQGLMVAGRNPVLLGAAAAVRGEAV